MFMNNDTVLIPFSPVTLQNGFQFGEHGLIDKRTMYEPSIRVTMVAHCPSLIKDGTVEERNSRTNCSQSSGIREGLSSLPGRDKEEEKFIRRKKN